MLFHKMPKFNGPKYQQGKIGGFRDPDPDAVELARRIARKTKITKIEVDGEEVLYIYVDFSKKRYSQSAIHNTIRAVKDEFKQQLPNTKVVVGFVDLHFSGMSEKQVFAEKIAGTVK